MGFLAVFLSFSKKEIFFLCRLKIELVSTEYLLPLGNTVGANGNKTLLSVTASVILLLLLVVEVVVIGVFSVVVVTVVSEFKSSFTRLYLDFASSGLRYFLATQFLKYSSLRKAPNTSLLILLLSSFSSVVFRMVVSSIVMGDTVVVIWIRCRTDSRCL